MPRYEGMDDIVEGLKRRLGPGAPEAEPVAHHHAEPVPLRRSSPPAMSVASAYADAVEHTVLLVRDAEELRTVLSVSGVRTLSEEERQDLINLLNRVTQEIRACEAALQRPV